MRDRPVIALIAGRVSLNSFGEEEQHGLWAAISVLRAVLERGGRALLSAESSYVVPLLMAAAEYQEPRRVETGEETVKPPVVLGPLVGVDSVEDELLLGRTDRGEAPEGLTLLEDLEGSGLLEQGRVRNDNARGVGDIFRALLSDHQPQGIIAVGDSTRTAPLIGAAESYQAQESRVRVRLLWVLAGGDRVFGAPWKLVDPRRFDERLPPPMLEGEIVGERSEGAPWDERLIMLAREAAEEASLALAIDRAVGMMIEEPEPLASF